MNYQLMLSFVIVLITYSCSSDKEASEPEVKIALPTENIKKQNPTAEGSTFTGKVIVKPNAQISVHVPINGYVEEVKCFVGTAVKKGEILAYIEHPDFLKLQEDYLQTKSEFRVEEENYLRKKELFEQKVISRKEFLESERIYEASSAHHKRLIAELRFVGIDPSNIKTNILEKLPIRAPGNGIVTEINANKGKFLNDSDQLLTIIDNSSVWIEFQLYPDQLDGIKESDTLEFRFGNEYGKAIINHVSIATNNTKSVSVICDPIGETNKWKVGQVIFGEKK